jgi:hypothetical protein
MEQYVGLDVAQVETAVCVIDSQGQRLWQGTCRSNPHSIALVLKRRAPQAVKAAMETGPLAVWLWHALRGEGIPVVCLHARHAKAAWSLQMNKTDANDAYGLAQIVRTGWYREVEVKSIESHMSRLLLAARAKMVSMRTMLYCQIRGLLKTFNFPKTDACVLNLFCTDIGNGLRAPYRPSPFAASALSTPLRAQRRNRPKPSQRSALRTAVRAAVRQRPPHSAQNSYRGVLRTRILSTSEAGR